MKIGLLELNLWASSDFPYPLLRSRECGIESPITNGVKLLWHIRVLLQAPKNLRPGPFSERYEAVTNLLNFKYKTNLWKPEHYHHRLFWMFLHHPFFQSLLLFSNLFWIYCDYLRHLDQDCLLVLTHHSR